MVKFYLLQNYIGQELNIKCEQCTELRESLAVTRL